MNLRHAAALALVGWYLMVPRPSNGQRHALKVDCDDTAKKTKVDHSGQSDDGR